MDNQLGYVQSSSGVQDKSPFYKSPKFWKIFFAFAVLIIILSSLVVFFGLRDSKEYDNKNDEYVADQVDIKLLASNKFKELMGVSYDDYKKLEQYRTESDVSALSARAEGAFDSASGVQNVAEVEGILRDVQDKESKVYYTEQEIKIKNPDALDVPFFMYSFSGGSTYSKHPLIDYNKPVTVKQWQSNLYSSKNLLEQDYKIINLLSTNSKFTLTYAGGDYAVKQNYGEQGGAMPLIAIEETEKDSIDFNPEISFIKYILEDGSNIKKVNETSIDGQKVYVYEEEQFPVRAGTISINNEDVMRSEVINEEVDPAERIMMRYYLDIDEFKLVKTELLKNGKVVEESRVIRSEVYDIKDNSSIFSYDELNSIEVKEVNFNISAPEPYKPVQAIDIIKKHDVYFIDNASNSVILEGFYDHEQDKKLRQVEDKLTKLINNKRFEPTYSERDSMSSVELMDDTSFPILSYSSYDDSASLIYEYYNTNPEESGYLIQPESIQKASDKIVFMNGLVYTGKYYEIQFESRVSEGSAGGCDDETNCTLEENIEPVPPPPDTINEVEYKLVLRMPNGTWLMITEFGSQDSKSYLKNQRINLTSLSTTRAQKMDQERPSEPIPLKEPMPVEPDGGIGDGAEPIEFKSEDR